MRWARILIKVEGNSRPSVVNILEGPRAYELQIWWEIVPWVTGVYPVSSSDEMKNLEEEEDVETRADKRVSFLGSKCSQAGQWEQAREAKMEKIMGSAVSFSVLSTSGAVLSGRGGPYSEMCWNKKEGSSASGRGPIQQAKKGGRTKARAGLLSGLKEKELNGPRDRNRRSSDGLKIRCGLKEELKRLKNGAHITNYEASSLGGEYGPVLFGL